MKSVLTINSLNKTYESGAIKVHALKNISLGVNEGDFLIITGRSGSGKSTLLRQLGLLDTPNSGEIFLNGENVTKMPEKKRATLRLNYIGYIFQEYALIKELSALENVMLPAMMIESPKVYKKHATELLTRLGLRDRLDNLPSELSGGQQQKVAIARALINNPSIIFADEPTANLDLTSAKEIMEIFKELNEKEKHTIMMITHEAEDVKYGSRVINLEDGEIA